MNEMEFQRTTSPIWRLMLLVFMHSDSDWSGADLGRRIQVKDRISCTAHRVADLEKDSSTQVETQKNCFFIQQFFISTIIELLTSID